MQPQFSIMELGVCKRKVCAYISERNQQTTVPRYLQHAVRVHADLAAAHGASQPVHLRRPHTIRPRTAPHTLLPFPSSEGAPGRRVHTAQERPETSRTQRPRVRRVAQYHRSSHSQRKRRPKYANRHRRKLPFSSPSQISNLHLLSSRHLRFILLRSATRFRDVFSTNMVGSLQGHFTHTGSSQNRR